MRAPRFSDTEIARMRDLKAEGRTLTSIADEFGTSKGFVSKVCSGKARPAIAGLSRELVTGEGVAAAVQSFTAGLTLDEGQTVLARSALALAQKVDALTSSDSVQGANAIAPVVKQLMAAMDELRGFQPREMDPLDQIRARLDRRRLVAAAGGDWEFSELTVSMRSMGAYGLRRPAGLG